MAEAWHVLGELLHEMGDEGSARNALNQAKSLFQAAIAHPDFAPSAHPYAKLGQVHYRLGELGESMDAFDRALGLDEKHGGAWAGKGKSLFDTGNTARALEAFEAALAIDNANPDARFGKWICLLRLAGGEQTLSTEREVRIGRSIYVCDHRTKTFRFLRLNPDWQSLDPDENAANKRSIDGYARELRNGRTSFFHRSDHLR